MEKKNLAKTIARLGIESILGGALGWHISDNLIHPGMSIDSGFISPYGSAMMNYMYQTVYNTMGAGFGAVVIPGVDILYNAHKKAKLYNAAHKKAK
ncbi:MAG: hypothetical protein AABW46_02985 [Nanoarchaeota archaeon]